MLDIFEIPLAGKASQKNDLGIAPVWLEKLILLSHSLMNLVLTLVSCCYSFQRGRDSAKSIVP
jgi:hypothetical protein